MIFYALILVILVLIGWSIRSEIADQKARHIRNQSYPWVKEADKEVWSFKKHADKVQAFVFPGIIGVVVGAVVVFMYVCGVWFTVWDSGTQYKAESENQNLAALDLGTSQESHGSVSGFATFLVGSYDSEGVKKLSYLADVTGDGGYQPQSMNGEDAILYEGVSTPHLTIETYNRIDNSGFWVPWDVIGKGTKTVNLFYVPKGSIQTKFNVDISK